MQPNVKLLAAIREQGFRQKEFAKIVGDHPTYVSRVINGWMNLDRGRQLKYARVLNRQPEDLFGGG